jgi:capsid protein
MISASSLSKNYDGTYSAQRQELVEQSINYACETDDYTTSFIAPVYRDLIAAAHLSGVLKRPRDLKPGSEFDALYVGQSMPWIDPLKEATANQLLVQSGFESTPAIIRSRGRNPDDVLTQQKNWVEKCRAAGVAFSTDVGVDPATLASMLNDPQPNNPASK